MPRYKLHYEPDMTPRLDYQKQLHRMAKDLDRQVIERDNIQPVITWTLDLIHTIYPGAEVLGPVTVKGGAVIFLGDTGELIIKPIKE